MPIITANGIRLAYDEAGAGPPVVWVHGSWTDRSGANLYLAPLLAEHYRVITYDRRGHSQSERPPGRPSVMDHVADLTALIEQLDAAPAHLVANSFGGEIALKLAVRHPDLVASLCLHEPCLFGLLPNDPDVQRALEDFHASMDLVAAELEQGHHEAGVRLFLDRVIGPGAWDAFPEQTRRTFVHNAPTWLDEENDPSAQTVDIGHLADVTVPVLLTQGGHSDPLFSADLGRLADALPNAHRSTLADASHVPHWTHPVELSGVIRGFLEDSSQRAS